VMPNGRVVVGRHRLRLAAQQRHPFRMGRATNARTAAASAGPASRIVAPPATALPPGAPGGVAALSSCRTAGHPHIAVRIDDMGFPQAVRLVLGAHQDERADVTRPRLDGVRSVP